MLKKLNKTYRFALLTAAYAKHYFDAYLRGFFAAYLWV